MSKGIDVSVIMAACNQGDWVRRTVPLAIESLYDLSYEIIVVDDQSIDGCCHGLPADTLVVGTRERLGVSQSRRLGFDQSRGNVIIWSDPHCEYPDGTLRRLHGMAVCQDAICQPRTKHDPGKKKSHAGSLLAISDRGLVTKPVGDAAPHPALYNTIYAVQRDVYEGLGGWPALPGVWGYSEQALSLMAWVAGVPIIVDEESLGIHHLYQDKRQFPYSMPRSDWAANAQWVHSAFFPETYRTFWLPKLLSYFGDDIARSKPMLGRQWRQFCRWVKDHRVRSEEECFAELLGIPMPAAVPLSSLSFLDAQRKRAEPRVHRAARGRVNRAVQWMRKAIPGCMGGRNVLDVGTRDGYALTVFAGLEAHTVHGVELVPETAEFARSNSGHPVDVADMRSLPQSENEWAIVSCIHVLEHVPDPGVAVAELVRVLKPGGWLFLVVPAEVEARRQYAHFCEFPHAQSLIDLVAKDDRLDVSTIKTDVVPYSGEKPEIRLVVRKRGASSQRKPRPRRETRVAKAEEQPGSEARFDSRKNPDCKDANLWTSYEGSAEVEVAEMLGGLIRGLQPDCVVETGSSHGRTSQVLGAALRANGHGQLYSLEHDIHLMRQSRRRCRGLPVQCVHTDSLKWDPPKDAAIDFAFFDSKHSIRVPEFHHLHQHMTTKTIVAFHDTSPRKRTRQPVEQLAAEGWIAPVFLPTPRGIVIARVLK